MRPRPPLLSLVLAASLSTSISRSACAQPRRSESADRAAIAATAREFSARYMRGDAAGMTALYTEDGVIFPGGRPMIRGREAIQQYWTMPPGVQMVEHQTVSDSVVIVGNTAYDWGTFHSRVSRDDEPGNRGYGKYVIVWRRGDDGQWRMHLDIWNGSPAP